MWPPGSRRIAANAVLVGSSNCPKHQRVDDRAHRPRSSATSGCARTAASMLPNTKARGHDRVVERPDAERDRARRTAAARRDPTPTKLKSPRRCWTQSSRHASHACCTSSTSGSCVVAADPAAGQPRDQILARVQPHIARQDESIADQDRRCRCVGCLVGAKQRVDERDAVAVVQSPVASGPRRASAGRIAASRVGARARTRRRMNPANPLIVFSCNRLR